MVEGEREREGGEIKRKEKRGEGGWKREHENRLFALLVRAIHMFNQI